MSALEDLAGLLRRMPVFAGVTAERLKLIAYLASTVDLKPGHELLRAGEPAGAVYIVTNGTLETRGTAHAGQFGPGSLLGEISALTGGAERVSVVAATESTAASFSLSQFEELLERLPEVKTGLLKDLARRLERQA